MGWADDALYVLFLLLTALVFVLYSVRAVLEQDNALAWASGIGAVVLVMGAVLYSWWVWLA
jgi:hypothetical protein